MPDETTPPPEDAKALALRTELTAVTAGIEVALGVKELAPAYAARRDSLLTIAEAFTKPPTNDDEQEQILAASRPIAKLRTEVEKQAKALRAPLNAGADAIIAIEKAAKAELKREEDRLGGLVNNYQMKVAEDRRKAEAEAEKERQRIANEQAAAERQRREAEEAQQRAEIARQQAEQLKGKAAEKAKAEADRLAKEAQEKDDAAFEAELKAQATVAPVVVPTSERTAREYFDFEIIGRTPSEQKASLIKLLCAHPEFFGTSIKSETPRGFSLSLKVNDLCDALNGKEPFKQITAAPGINITSHLTKLR